MGQGWGRGGAGAEWEDGSPVDMHVNIGMYVYVVIHTFN